MLPLLERLQSLGGRAGRHVQARRVGRRPAAGRKEKLGFGLRGVGNDDLDYGLIFEKLEDLFAKKVEDT